MQEDTFNAYKARAAVAKALAHPSRLFILDALSRSECCVCELAQMVGADVSTVSKHLAQLRNAGLITDEKRGLQVYYSLKCACIMDFFRCVEAVLTSNAEEHAAVAQCSLRRD